MTEPLVSILIPAFNAGPWIGEALESALAQTWKQTEILVVDDGSTDETAAVAKRYASRRVKVIEQENQGASSARNTAYSYCQGDYMQWLDADDLLASDKIERQVEVVRGGISDRTLLSGAWGSFHYRPRKAVFEPSALWESLSPVDWLVAKMSGNLHMQPDAWLVSRALTEDAGPWDTGLWRDNDGEYFCRVLLASDKVCFVPEARTYYRTAGFNNISYIGRSNRKLESLFRSLRLHVQYLRSLEDTDRTRSACVRYLNNWVSEFYPDRMDFVDRLRILAEELGGRIEVPTLSWKYEWIRRAFGWEAAKQSQLRLRKLRNSLVIGWDRLLYAAERRRDHSTRASRTLPQGRAS